MSGVAWKPVVERLTLKSIFDVIDIIIIFNEIIAKIIITIIIIINTITTIFIVIITITWQRRQQ